MMLELRIMVMVAVCCFHRTKVASYKLQSDQLDDVNFAPDSVSSGSDQIANLQRRSEFSGANDISSGYPSGSSEDTLPWTIDHPKINEKPMVIENIAATVAPGVSDEPNKRAEPSAEDEALRQKTSTHRHVEARDKSTSSPKHHDTNGDSMLSSSGHSDLSDGQNSPESGPISPPADAHSQDSDDLTSGKTDNVSEDLLGEESNEADAPFGESGDTPSQPATERTHGYPSNSTTKSYVGTVSSSQRGASSSTTGSDRGSTMLQQTLPDETSNGDRDVSFSEIVPFSVVEISTAVTWKTPPQKHSTKPDQSLQSSTLKSKGIESEPASTKLVTTYTGEPTLQTDDDWNVRGSGDHGSGAWQELTTRDIHEAVMTKLNAHSTAEYKPASSSSEHQSSQHNPYASTDPTALTPDSTSSSTDPKEARSNLPSSSPSDASSKSPATRDPDVDQPVSADSDENVTTRDDTVATNAITVSAPTTVQSSSGELFVSGMSRARRGTEEYADSETWLTTARFPSTTPARRGSTVDTADETTSLPSVQSSLAVTEWDTTAEEETTSASSAAPTSTVLPTTTSTTTTTTTAPTTTTSTPAPTTPTTTTTTTTTETTTRETKARFVGGICTSDSSCSSLVDSRCIGGRCYCPDGYFQNVYLSGCWREPYSLETQVLSETCFRPSWLGGDVMAVYLVNVNTVENRVATPSKTWEFTKTYSNRLVCGFPGGSKLRVTVKFQQGGGNTSAVLSLPPNPPERLKIVDVNQTCMAVTWDKGQGRTDFFRVEFASQRGGEQVTEVKENTAGTEWTQCQLNPASRYAVRVTAISNLMTSRQPASVGPRATAPLAVTNLKADDVGTTHVELSWKRAGSSEKYIVRWGYSRSSRWDSLTFTANTTSARIEGLRPATSYELHVLSVFSSLNTPSASLMVTTATRELTYVNVESSGSHLNVSWEVADSADFYVRVVIEDRYGAVNSTDATESPFVLDTHMRGACFSVKVTPVWNRTPGKVHSFQTYTDEDVPQEVTGLVARRLASDRTAVNVTWRRPGVTNGPVQTYRVSVSGQRGLVSANRTLQCEHDCRVICTAHSRPSRDVAELSFSGADEELWVVVDGLSEYEDYDVTVVASTSSGTGPPAVDVALGQLLDAVTNIQISAHNASCILLTWNPPENADVIHGVDNTSYVAVEYRKDDDDVSNDDVIDDVTSVRAEAATLVACGLEFWTRYQFNLTAYNRQGAGKTLTEFGTTAEHVPGPVVNLTVSPEPDILRPRTLLVSWLPPTERNGLLRGYSVIVREVGKETVFQRKTLSVLERRLLASGAVIYQLQTVSLPAEHRYRVQVLAATGAGFGPPETATVTVPAGALPQPRQKVSVDAVTSGQSISPHTARLLLPKALFCPTGFGQPRLLGYLVSGDGWVDTAIRSGVTVGSNPVVRESWDDVDLSSPSVAFFVRLGIDTVRASCAKDGTSMAVVVGEKGSERCRGVDGGRGQCGGPLRADTTYRVRGVFCTAAACTYSLPSPAFRTMVKPDTDKGVDTSGLAAGLVVLFLLLVIAGAGVGYYMHRRGKKEPAPREVELQEPTPPVEKICRNRPVSLDEFTSHVERLHGFSNLGFSEEYREIKENSRMYSTRAAELPACKTKNRFIDTLPWDKSRVKLLPTDDEEESDYINASYLPGEHHQREFIAAQGPLRTTIDDFWRMVWENRVQVVVMLTRCVEKGKNKCEKYWPDEGEQEIYGDLVVKVRSQSVLPDYIIRVIDIKLGNQSRMIKHFHFIRWPDHGCPEKTSMLLNFVSSVRAHLPHSGAGPTLVHCSAGVGRTGTFIALDRLLLQIRHQSHVDIFGLVLTMRDHRKQMVQTENQYIYIHDCLVDALTKDRESDDESDQEDDEHVYGNC